MEEKVWRHTYAAFANRTLASGEDSIELMLLMWVYECE